MNIVNLTKEKIREAQETAQPIKRILCGNELLDGLSKAAVRHIPAKRFPFAGWNNVEFNGIPVVHKPLLYPHGNQILGAIEYVDPTKNFVFIQKEDDRRKS